MTKAFSQILSFAKKHHGVITAKDLAKLGFHREYLRLLVRANKLVRIQNGIYSIYGDWEDVIYAQQVKKKHIIYSHETALYFHALSDREPLKYSITLPFGYHYQFKSNLWIPHYVKASLFEVGKMVKVNQFGNLITLYNKERSLCDVLKIRNRMDKQLMIDALKRYVNDPKKDIPELLRYAKLFRVEKILSTYLEVLL